MGVQTRPEVSASPLPALLLHDAQRAVKNWDAAIGCMARLRVRMEETAQKGGQINGGDLMVWLDEFAWILEKSVDDMNDLHGATERGLV